MVWFKRSESFALIQIFTHALYGTYVQELSHQTQIREHDGKERRVPFEVLMKMKQNFNLPTQSEGFDQVDHLQHSNISCTASPLNFRVSSQCVCSFDKTKYECQLKCPLRWNIVDDFLRLKQKFK